MGGGASAGRRGGSSVHVAGRNKDNNQSLSYLRDWKGDQSSAGVSAVSCLEDNNHDLNNDEAEDEEDTKAFSILGVQLSFIDQYIEDCCGGRKAIVGLTTGQVYKRFVESKTEEAKCSYCELVTSKVQDHVHSKSVGRATVYVSNTWTFPFLDVVNTLKHHFVSNQIDEETIFLWIDLFSKSPHHLSFSTAALGSPNSSSLTMTFWSDIFKPALGEIGHTLMIASPADEFGIMPMASEWGLWELCSTLETKSRLEVRKLVLDQPPTTSKVYVGQDSATDLSEQTTTIEPVTTTNSTIINKNDNQHVKDRRRSSLYSVAHNEVHRWLHSCVVSSATATTAATTTTNLSSVLCGLKDSLGELYDVRGQYDIAIQLCQDVLDVRRSTLGLTHPDTMRSLTTVATLFDEMGQTEKAIVMYREILNVQRTVNGDKHPEYLATLNDLAGLFEEAHKYIFAEPLYIECLNARREVLGETHVDTMGSINNLAWLYFVQGRFIQSEPLYTLCLNLSRDSLGDRHPLYLTTLNNMARLHVSMGREESAEKMFKDCLAARKVVLGDKHPDYLFTLSSLAKLYDKQGRYEEAEPLLVSCLDVRKQVLGVNNRATMASMFNLARSYDKQNMPSLAEPLHKECLRLRKEALGNRHPDTVSSLGALAWHYENNGQQDLAKPLFKELMKQKKRMMVVRVNED